MKKVVILNGSGGVGKDSLVISCKDFCNTKHVSSVTEVKGIATLMGWDGEKTEKSRRFLSDLKDLMTNYNDRPLNYSLEQIKEFYNTFPDNSILFIDIREPIEIEKLVKIDENIMK